MAIVGITLNRDNPPFTVDDFLVWMPQFTKYLETPAGQKTFAKIYGIANNRVFYSIFGSDWELAMSYVIAHYLTLIGQQQQAPSGSTLGEIAGGGTTRGVLTGASIGEFQKTYDLSLTTLNTPEALFWNQTSYGASFMALLKTKAIPSIMVVTSNPIPDYKQEMPWEKPSFTNPATADDIRYGKEAMGVTGIKMIGTIEDYTGEYKGDE